MSAIHTNITTIKEKHPNFEQDFNMEWRNIIKKCLTNQFHRNPKSSRLTGVREECRKRFGYLDDAEIAVVQDRISDKLVKSKFSSEWDSWRNRLPNIFRDEIEINISPKQAVLNFDDDGFPTSVKLNEESSDVKEETYTMQVTSDLTGKTISSSSGIPKDITMTILSDLYKSLAGQ